MTANADDRESLRDSLEQHRCELRAAMEDMGAAARSWSDPTVSIRSRPITWVVAAFLVGAWLGHQR